MARGLVLDTSVWIEYLKANPKYFYPCQEHLDRNMVYSLEIIFAELLQGARGGREIGIINGYYENLPPLDHRELIYEAGLFSHKEGLFNKGIGLVDAVIIYATLKNRLQIWTLDKKIIRYLDHDHLFQGKSPDE